MKPVALITGGCRGIGLGIAQCLAAENCDLAVCGTRPSEAVTDVLTELRALGADALYCQADIADRAARAHMVADIRRHFGRLNILVNNAGIAPKIRADLLTASEESYDEVMNTNLKGPYFLTQAVANWLIEQQQANADFRGCIINITSISAVVASTNRGEYCLSKAGLSMTTKLWAARLGEFGLPVYEVRPGLIKTDMTTAVQEKYDMLLAAGLTIQPRWGLPADVGRAVVMLARGDLAYSTGQVIMVDGGLTVERL